MINYSIVYSSCYSQYIDDFNYKFLKGKDPNFYTIVRNTRDISETYNVYTEDIKLLLMQPEENQMRKDN